MSDQDYPQEFLDRLKTITSKRAKTVIDHILQHGFVTTEELKTLYNYDHPPRAARDVREQGIALVTFPVQNTQGRVISAYKFADPSLTLSDTLGGRKTFSKAFKKSLFEQNGSRCAICLTEYEERYLQIDHRVPYQVAGEPTGTQRELDDYMLLCGSCNRAKSWSCEHCTNWTTLKDANVCLSCYWASPAVYKHIALAVTRRLELVWTQEEIGAYEQLRRQAEANNEPMPEYVKAVLERQLDPQQDS